MRSIGAVFDRVAFTPFANGSFTDIQYLRQLADTEVRLLYESAHLWRRCGIAMPSVALYLRTLIRVGIFIP